VSGVEVEIAVGVPATAIPVNAVVGVNQLIASPCLFLGWSLRNNSGVLADCEFLDGGNPFAELQCSAYGVSNQWYGYPGVYCRGGLSLNCITQPEQGAVFVVLL
jgi:hypothetical protein